MGGLTGHAALGLFFLLIGLWHLYNHTTMHATNHGRNYNFLPWFPTSFLRHLELYLIMFSCATFTFFELHHLPFDSNGIFLSSRLHHLEHGSMATTFFIYALFALVLDQARRPYTHDVDMIMLLAAVSFAQELLLFHFHSTDHVGVEGQYHLLLQLVIFVSLLTTLMGIGWRKSFLVAYVRSLSIMLQGIWLVVMGIMLWTPEFIPKGCRIQVENGRDIVRCNDREWLQRAKALVNIEFSWLLMGVAVFGVCFYIVIDRVVYGGKGEDCEHSNWERKGFVQLHHVEKGFAPVDTTEV
ncbi:hypothetical protein Ancab_001416 [Ancistrocladus abbreviatus]